MQNVITQIAVNTVNSLTAAVTAGYRGGLGVNKVLTNPRFVNKEREMDQFHVTYGPPGCGKTTNMAARARQFVAEYGSHAVLIASLTKAAATEIASRDTGVAKQNVGTLHSFCLRQLGMPPIAEVEAKKWNSEYPHWYVTPADEQQEKEPRSRGLFEITGDDLLEECGVLRARMIPPDQWGIQSEYGGGLIRFWSKWCEWKDDCGFLDFTDLIEHAVDRVKLPPRGCTILLFDEAQDYSALEFKLCMQWGEHADHVRFTGDPDQNLYQWRGADPHVFMGDAIPRENKSVLSQSYRVPGAVRDYAMSWIRQIHDRDDIQYQPTDKPGTVERTWSNWMQPDGDVFGMVEQAEQSGEDLMVLTACNYMLHPTISELRRRGVRFHNPFRRKNGSWNPLRVGGKRTSAADRLLRFMNLSMESDPATLKEWLEPLEAKILDKGAKARAKNLEVGLDLGALRDLFQEESDFMHAMDGNLEWYRDHVIGSRQKAFTYPVQVVQNYAPGDSSRAQKIAALTGKPRVIVGTCHSVKGGEADNVLVYPNISWAAKQGFDDSPDPVIRQFYVGMTRAKKALYLGDALRGRKHHSVEWL